MARAKKKDIFEDAVNSLPSNDMADMPLTTYGEYQAYNTRARALNKDLGLCRYPCQQCPEELHPTQRVIFNRKDQPMNPIKVYLSNDKIHYERELVPGQRYDLPHCVIEHLSERGTAVWDWVDLPDGSKVTKKVSVDPRFNLRSVFSE